MRVADGAALQLRPAIGIQDVALHVRPQQRLRLVLPVQVDKQRAQLSQDPDGRGAAVYPGTGPPFRNDFALQDEHPLLRLHPQGGQSGTETGGGGRRQLEGALDHRLLRSRAYDVHGRSFAEQQGEGVHEHGFPRPGLSGEDVQAGLQGERDVGDDGEVADAQLREHYLRSRSERSPHWSFFRMRAKKPSAPSRINSTGRSARFVRSRSPGWIVVPT